jgi:hypothetical protein
MFRRVPIDSADLRQLGVPNADRMIQLSKGMSTAPKDDAVGRA